MKIHSLGLISHWIGLKLRFLSFVTFEYWYRHEFWVTMTFIYIISFYSKLMLIDNSLILAKSQLIKRRGTVHLNLGGFSLHQNRNVRNVRWGSNASGSGWNSGWLRCQSLGLQPMDQPEKVFTPGRKGQRRNQFDGWFMMMVRWWRPWWMK